MHAGDSGHDGQPQAMVAVPASARGVGPVEPVEQAGQVVGGNRLAPVLDPDGDLDWPNLAKVRKWWSANQSRFAKGQRHLCGKPITPTNLDLVLKTGWQRHRAAAALELALLRPREPMIEVRNPTFAAG